MAHWYAAIVKRQKERGFCDALEALGFEGYVPREDQRVLVQRRPKRYEMRPRPIIRGVVFIGAAADLANDAYAWQAVASLPAYKAILGMEGIPQRIRQSQIDAMIAEGQKRAADLHVGAPRPKVKAGDEARMTAGAFEGLRATVKELTGRRAVILLRLLGGEREIPVDAMQLAPWAAE